MSRLSPTVNQILRDIIASEFRTRGDSLEDSILTLSERFTRNLDHTMPAYLDDPALARAYLAYYLPVNAAKVSVLLAEMPEVELAGREPHRPVRILELGSGPGTGVFPLVDWYAQKPWRKDYPLEIVSVDRSATALELGNRLSKKLLERVGLVQATVHTVQVDLERVFPPRGESQGIPSGPYDLILVANCLNELFRTSRDPTAMRVEFVRQWLDSLTNSGTFMILEPALRAMARELHRIRNELLREGACTVYSPCLHDRPCPALVNPNDWCHEERVWTAPDWVSALDRQVGFIKDALKFAYLLLRKDGRTIVPRQPNVFRVVSELRTMKGDTRGWLCNETGRPEVGRMDREWSKSNAAVDEWHRGAIVRISEILRKERKGREAMVGRIPASATVEIVRPI